MLGIGPILFRQPFVVTAAAMGLLTVVLRSPKEMVFCRSSQERFFLFLEGSGPGLQGGLGMRTGVIPMDSTVESVLQTRISSHLRESAAIKLKVEDACSETILKAAHQMARSLRDGGKLMLCGNGGSAADAQHIAGEFVNRLNRQFTRPPMAAVALPTDTPSLTATGNDFGFEFVFERQVLALGRPGDVLIAISTSGRSENVIRAVRIAAQKRVTTIGMLGQGGGLLAPLVETAVVVPSDDVQRIQEAHITIGHILCDLVERIVFGCDGEDRREFLEQ